MATRYYANAPATTLTASISNVATSMTVASTTGLPISYPYTMILDRGTASEEAVSVTAAAGSVLTITRGIDSTTAFAHSNGASAVHGITAQDVREPNTHINSSSGVHGLTGAVVGTTDTQTLSNKTLSGAVTSADGAVVGTTGTQTLTNKTISRASNTINGFTSGKVPIADFDGKLVDGQTGPGSTHVGITDTQTLTNKTISADSNTLSGIAASSFVLSDASGNINGAAAQKAIPSGVVVGTTDTQTLTNKTLTSPTITGIGAESFIRKTADEPVTSSTTLQNDNELLLPIPGAGTYLFELHVVATSAANAAGDITVSLSWPTGDCDWFGHGLDIGLASGTIGSLDARARLAATSGVTVLDFGVSTATTTFRVHGVFIATGPTGDLQFMWAQNVSNANATTVKAGSYMTMKRVA